MSIQPQPVSLSYERSRDRPARPRPGWYTCALILGLTPLIFGTAVFCLWLLTGRRWLVVTGIFTILIGTVLVLGGIVLLVAYVLNQRRLPGISRPHLYRRSA